MSDAEEVLSPPPGVTVSTILGSAAQAALPPAQPYYGEKKKKFKKSTGTKIRVDSGPGISTSTYDDEYDEEDEGEVEAGGVAAQEAMAARLGIPTSLEGTGPLLPGSLVGYGRSGHNPQRTLSAMNYQGKTFAEYKKAVIAILNEFVVEADLDATLRELHELGTPHFSHELVKRALIVGIEKSDKERELISRLLSNVYGVDVPMDRIGSGFIRLMEALEDLRLDNPDAAATTAKFISRAVADEILPPAFLNDAYLNSLAPDVVAEAKALLSVAHSAERLEHVWHVTGAFSVPDLKAAIVTAVKEYYLERDLPEAVRCMRELESHHFMHEAIYRSLVVALETWPAKERMDAAVDLVGELRKGDTASDGQVLQGVRRVVANLPDIQLDCPGAHAGVLYFMEKGAEKGVLPASINAALLTAAPEPEVTAAAGGAGADAASGGGGAASSTAAATTKWS